MTAASDPSISDAGAIAADHDSGSPFWASDAESLQSSLGSSPTGLTLEAAAGILERVGPNRLETRTEDSVWRLLGRQFISPIELILIAATILSGALGDWTDAAIILVILLSSGMLGFSQERNAGRAMSVLLATVEVSAVIKRDGKNTDVPVGEVVPGDIAVVSAGDLIPGDCLVLSSNSLTVDESALTGETFPAEKMPGIVYAGAPLTERSNAAFLGTHVASGMGTLLVVRTGRRTEIASISARLNTRPPQNRFERGMTSFGVLLTRLMVVLVVVIFAINLILQRPIIDSALFSLALAVGLTPQLLPAIVSISLAQGAKMMARTRVIVRRLDAIEDFGSMTVLCSDKTGTMTAGEIELDGVMALDGEPSSVAVELASLNAGLQVGWKNPIDTAIIAAHPVSVAAVALDEIPYDFLRKRVSVLVRRSPGEEPILVSKGALDPILGVCSHATVSSGTVPIAEALEGIQQRFADLSAQGFRVLGIATRQYPGQEKVAPGDESGMTLVGLLTFADPVKWMIHE